MGYLFAEQRENRKNTEMAVYPAIARRCDARCLASQCRLWAPASRHPGATLSFCQAAGRGRRHHGHHRHRTETIYANRMKLKLIKIQCLARAHRSWFLFLPR